MSDRSDITSPLRVLHIGKYFPPHPGGMETYLRDLMNVQKRQGLDVQALVHSSDARLFDTVESVSEPSGLSYGVTRCARWFNLGFVPISPLFLLSAFLKIKRFRPNIIHVHLPNASVAWLLMLPSALRIKWIVHWHSDIETADSSLLVKAAYYCYRPLERLQLLKADKIIATSPPYLASSAPLARVKDKCTVIPLALDERRLPTKRAVGHITGGADTVILFVGRFSPYKNISALIEAIAMTSGHQLWLVGDGEERGQLECLTQDLGLSDRVKFWGAVGEEKIWQLYRASDLFCLPSRNRNEAFGLVLLEAAHFELNLVVPNVEGSGMPWVAQNLQKSSIARNTSARAIADAVVRSTKKSNSRTNGELFDLGAQARLIQKLY